MSTSEFYDNFIHYQINTGINDRISGLYKRLCRTGISDDSRILEIGCGIGSLTYLLSKKIKKGPIEAIDISEKSIAFAKKNLGKRNITFSVAGISGYKPKNTSFDRILLFDVLEHIPVSEHDHLFSQIADWMNEDSLLLVNIPNPDYIVFEQQHQPEALQEIDLPLYTPQLVASFSAASLELVFFEKYSVWVKDDYHFFILSKKKTFKEELQSTRSGWIKRVVTRLKREFRKMIFRYPAKHNRII